MLTLTLSEEGSSQTIKLSQELITVGRSKENLIIVKNKKASRAHAKIERIGGTYQITDLGSGNGTKVNGSKIDFHTLAAGDEIKIGDATLVLKSIDDGEEFSVDSGDVEKTDVSDETAAPDAEKIDISSDEGDELEFKDDMSERETEIIVKPEPPPKAAPPARPGKPMMLGKPAAGKPGAPPAKGAPAAGPAKPSLADRLKKKKP